jgi:hypothetical protein
MDLFIMKIFIEHVIIMGIDNSLQVSGGPKPPPLSYISKSPMEATADIHILPGFAGYAQKISIQVSTISTMAI